MENGLPPVSTTLQKRSKRAKSSVQTLQGVKYA